MNNEKIGGGELEPGAIVSTPELLGSELVGGQGVEKVNERKNRESGIAEQLPVVPDMPPMMPAIDDQDNGRTQEEKSPEVAVDGHKIENGWVSQTKKVLDETKGDPREKEVKVNELKADYMLKRFNRRLGDRN